MVLSLGRKVEFQTSRVFMLVIHFRVHEAIERAERLILVTSADKKQNKT